MSIVPSRSSVERTRARLALDAYCEPVPETPTYEERLSEFGALLADLERVV